MSASAAMKLISVGRKSSASDYLFELRQEKERLVKAGQLTISKAIVASKIEAPPFSIPTNWNWVYLNEVSIIQEGPGIRKSQYRSEGIQFLTVTNILEGKVDLEKSKKYVSAEEFGSKYSHFKINRNDIVVACSGGSWGKSAIFDCDDTVILNTSTLRLRFFGDLGDNKYLYYLTKADFFKQQIEKQLTGQQPNFGYSHYSRVQIPLPPIAEQKRIANILDEAMAGIATAITNAEMNFENARAIFASHVQSVFTRRGKGWVINKLNSITMKIGSGATPRGGEDSYKAEGISLIRSLNVHDLGFKYAKLAFLDDAQANELSNVEVQSRDVLLNITGASVARCCIVPDDVLPARVNQHVSIIRPIAEKVDADLLHYLLISKPYKNLLLKTGEEGGSTRQAITKAQIQEFTVEYPATLKEQKTIVAKLDSMLAETQRLAAIYEQKLEALAALKKSLLHQAFTGEL